MEQSVAKKKRKMLFCRLLIAVACILCIFLKGSYCIGGWDYSSKFPASDSPYFSAVWNETIYVLHDRIDTETSAARTHFKSIWILDPKTLVYKKAETTGQWPSPRAGISLSTSDGKLYLFGGTTSEGNFNDIHVLDLTTFEWKEIDIFGTQPMKRFFATSFFWREELYIYGGNYPYDLNDLWSFNPGTNTWSLVNTIEPKVRFQFGTIAVEYKSKMYSYGGCGVLEPSCSASLITYDLEKRMWEDTVTYGERSQSFASLVAYNDQLFVFGGQRNATVDFTTFGVTVIDLVTKGIKAHLSWTRNAGPSQYPITFPSGRLFPMTRLIGRSSYVIGGTTMTKNNDVWVMDMNELKWVKNNLHNYPVPRSSPRMAVVSSTELAIFGGLYVDTHIPPTPINDLWIYNTADAQWTRLVQESNCYTTDQTCAPNVYLPAFGHYDGYLYLLGGFSLSMDVSPVARKYSLVTRSWSGFILKQQNDFFTCMRYDMAYRTIGTKLMIWGGTYPDQKSPESDVVVFSMQDESFEYLASTQGEIPSQPGFSGLDIHSKFCISGQNNHHPSIEKGIWCFNQGTTVWNKVYGFDDELVVLKSQIEFYHNLVLIGGEKLESTSADQFLAFDVEGQFSVNLGAYVRPVPLHSGATIVLDGVMYLFGAINDVFAMNALYSFNLAELWCSGTTTIDGRNAYISDGSGEFKYYPGTSCTWIVDDVTHIVVDGVDILDGVDLTIETIEDCDKPLMLSGVEHDSYNISKKDEGQVFQTPSHKIRIRFRVEKNATPAQGFSLKSFGCKSGFVIKSSACTCEAGHFINNFGNCIACPAGFKQEMENQEKCIPENALNGNAPQGNIMQGILQEFTQYPGPTFHGAVASIGNSLFVVGGVASFSEANRPRYMSMSIIYRSDSIYDSIWTRLSASGDVPKERSGFCFVAFDAIGLMMGGDSEQYDPFIYEYNPSSNSWKRLASMDVSSVGSSCTVHNRVVYIHGGYVNGTVTSEMWSYDPANNRVSKISTKGPKPSIAYAAGGIENGLWFLFGGYNGVVETQDIYKFEFATKTWYEATTVKLDGCVSCEQDRPVCIFNRQKASATVREGEIHIYGGISQSDVLGDLLVVEIASGTIVSYENYGMYAPDLPFTNPPPKYGAASTSWNNNLLILGGIGSSNTIGNDIWVWDPETRTWSDSSVLRIPLHRTDATMVSESSDSFLVFGGAATFVGELLLNDLWRFNMTENRWYVLFRESRTLGPAGRAGAIGALYGRTLFIFGGRPSVRFNDEKNLWMFNLETQMWSSLSIASSLSRNERPFNRIGIRSAQIGHKIYLWGGELMPGLEDVERYSLVFEVDLSKQEVARVQPVNVGPTKRRYHQMRAINQSTFYVAGGENFGGKPLNDAWIFNIETMVWTRLDVLSTVKPEFVQSEFISYGNTSIFFGGRQSTALSWMVQQDFKRIVPLGVWSDGMFPSRIFGHSVAVVDGKKDITVFGGSDESWTSNQIFDYMPGFCNPHGTMILSTSTPALFHDGSGEGNYLENTSCSWTLKNATQIRLNYQIRKQDRIEIYEMTGDSAQGRSIYVSNAETDRVVLSSTAGFFIQFKSKGVTDSSFEACERCYGFDVVHAGCAQNSHLSMESDQCICDHGYIRSEGICKTDVNQGSEQSVVLGAALGSVAGAILVVAGISGKLYRDKLKKMQSREKALYMHVEFKYLEFGSMLGFGSFGEVYRGRWRGTEVAIKKLVFSKMNKNALKEFEHEVSVMVELRHPNLVLYMAACVEPPNLCIISELMQRGSLYDILHDEKIDLSVEMKISFLLDAAKGLQYLHLSTPPILHRDLKSPNLLIDGKWNCKVSDFGLSGVSKTTEDNSPPGTLLWMAPEIIEGLEYTSKADVYSYAIIIWEVFTRKEPYHDEIAESITYRVVKNGLRPPIPDSTEMPSDISSMMTKAWSQSLEDRPDLTTIVNSLSSTYNDKHSTSFSSMTSFGTTKSTINSEAVPTGVIAIVFTDVQSSMALWESFGEEMVEALSIHNEIMRGVITRNRGYEVKTEGDAFMVTFTSVQKAVLFALQSQELLVATDWPARILNHPSACKVVSKNVTIFNGLRVRMGIHWGEPICKQDPVTGRMDYLGPVVNKAARIGGFPKGGQIVLSDAAFQEIDGSMESLGSPWMRDLGEHTLKGVTGSVKLYEILPLSLSDRASHFVDISSTFTSSSPFARNTVKPEDAVESNVGDEWQINYEDIVFSGTELGSGTFGVVFLGEYKGEQVAVKRVIKQKMPEKQYFAFLAETLILRDLHHPNILRFCGACTKQPNICLLLEYAPHGSLRDVLNNQKINLTFSQQVNSLCQVADAMAFLHSRVPIVIHRDLKCANVLVTSLDPMNVKIGDFGLARVKSDNQTMTKCGTRAWLAPEVLRGARYDESADVFSYAVMIWEVFTREKPYSNIDPLKLNFEVVNGLRPSIPKSLHSGIFRLMSECWDGEPKKRPSFADILQALKGIQ